MELQYIMISAKLAQKSYPKCSSMILCQIGEVLNKFWALYLPYFINTLVEKISIKFSDHAKLDGVDNTSEDKNNE